MNWKNYEKWLLENILQKNGRGVKKLTFQPLAIEKYSLVGSEELEKSLNDFFNSVERKRGDLTYRLLPEWEEGKTWEELFPERRETIFGLRSKKIPPSEKVWGDLIKLYNHWGTEAKTTEKLTEEAEQLRVELEQKSKEVVINLVSKTNAESEFFARYRNWLTDYQLLGQEAQENLRGYKEAIEKDQNLLQKDVVREKEATERIERWIQILEKKIELLKLENEGRGKTIAIISFFISIMTAIIILMLLYYFRVAILAIII